ncbi:fimbrial protein [Phytobacter sp. AG2a]
MVRKGIYVLLMVSGLFAFSGQANALCWFRSDRPLSVTKTLTMPVNASISVTAGLAVGQKVYDQDIRLANQGAFSIQCDAAGPYFHSLNLNTTLSETLPGSKTWATNLTGIGIKISTDAGAMGAMPVTQALSGCANSWSCGWSAGYSETIPWWLEIFKTGNTVEAGTIDASTLPEIVYTAGQADGMVEIYRIQMTGTITVTVPTCNITPASKAMTVNMGVHKLSDFSGTGSHSGWVDASIYLDGCGQFNGYGTSTNATYNGSTVAVRNAFTSNKFSVTLTPLNGVAAGAMKLKDQSSGATGFGIQLSRSQSDAGIMNLTGATYNYTDPLSNNGSTTVTVPLYARYIQTAATPTGGKADGMLEYTVSYK